MLAKPDLLGKSINSLVIRNDRIESECEVVASCSDEDALNHPLTFTLVVNNHDESDS